MCLVKGVGDGSEGAPGTVMGMEDESTVQVSADEGLRPCDFCGHPVVLDSVDEYDCPVCGDSESR